VKGKNRKAWVYANHLRQVRGAVSAYVAHSHQYPTADEWGQLELTGSGGPLLPYLAEGQATFICPQKQGAIRPGNPNPAFGLFSYGYNGAGAAPEGRDLELGLGLLRRICESRVKIPSEMIEAGDSGLGELLEGLLNPTEIPSLKEAQVTENVRWTSPRHRGRANFLFCDNHVSCGRRKHWVQKTPESRRQWSNDNQPHREIW